MKILITGGAGYIGSHACKALAQAGYEPIAYDNLSNGHRWAVQWGPLEAGDINDRTRLDEVIRKHKPAAVMHFAAFIDVAESVADPGKYYRNNVAGTLNLLQSVRDHGIQHFVFSSTAAVYGMPEASPITESHPLNPINPYGASKLMIEQMLKDFETAHGVRSIVLRYFNAAGADPEARIGEAHDPETHLIPLVLDAANGKRKEITLYGDDYNTPDGTCVRDYIHVDDLADAHVLSLEALQAGSHSKVYNLGNGQGFSVREVIDQACKITDHKIPLRIGPRRAGDAPSLVADATQIKKDLNWIPRYQELEQIIDTAWQWHLYTCRTKNS